MLGVSNVSNVNYYGYISQGIFGGSTFSAGNITQAGAMCYLPPSQPVRLSIWSGQLLIPPDLRLDASSNSVGGWEGEEHACFCPHPDLGVQQKHALGPKSQAALLGSAAQAWPLCWAWLWRARRLLQPTALLP